MDRDALGKWEAVADDVLSVIMINPKQWVEAMNANVTSQDMPPGKYRAVYPVVIALASDKQTGDNAALHDTPIAIQAGAGVSVEWVAERMAIHGPERERVFATQLDTLKAFGKGSAQLDALQRGITRTKAALNNGLDVEGAAVEVMSDLQRGQEQSSAVVDMGDIASEAETMLDAPPMKTIRTGINLLDGWLDGLGTEEFLAWGGPEKQRKTSGLASSLVNIGRTEKHIIVFSFDENRVGFYFRLMAIFMAEWLHTNNLYDLADEKTGAPLNNVSRKILLRVGNGWKQWPEPLKEAREYARGELAKFKGFVRVYDQTTCPPDLVSMSARIRKDAQMYGVDGIYIDHAQSLKGYTSEYDLLRAASTEAHSWRGANQCFVWLLSQQNKTGIAGNDAGSWSAEFAGGPSLERLADTIIVSKYMQGDNPDPKLLKIELKKARDEGGQRWGNVKIHPASGWILPDKVTTTTNNVQEMQDKAIGARQ